MPSTQDLIAKKGFIEAFFEDLAKKIAFTDDLYSSGHEDEARLLCCTYIEAIGNGLEDPSTGAAECFVRVLEQHGGESVLALIHPKALKESLPYKSVAPADKLALDSAIAGLPPNEALTKPELRSLLAPKISGAALSFLERESWRATVAMIAYGHIRSLGVHWFGSPSALTFSSTTHHGTQLPDVDFALLRRALDRIFAHAKQLSLATNKWFGRK
jgi:hypothetical protein